ncbi:DUF1266 domain-containing protein [Streptomyces sp. GC420]|uniref:DUF1266 domain-containing protein n=1 Tax=Streptomyces sp. GC420 TaxID=2697568 RepID=UPI001414E7B2|nr:DUF1266 domain-containing protein [Streptomyces sp. GC420]NBM18005.1 DUF1266 domain-containing protein [Streptomyces sp. GC420]
MTGATGWVPPTETERLLYEARMRDDWETELTVLSRTRLYLPIARLHADTPGFTAPLVPGKDPLSGKPAIHVFTPGMLPPWHPEWVHRYVTLTELAESWPNDKWRLSVNPGTPCATSLEAKPVYREAWQEIGAETGGPRRGVLITHLGGPLHGALAHGLACGAHLSVHNGVPWNQLGTTYFDYAGDVSQLRGTWHVTNRAQYHDKLTDLFEARFVDRHQEFALRARSGLAQRLGRVPSREEWLDTVTQALALRKAGDDTSARAREAVELTARCEERLRSDGVLGPGQHVDSLAAFDYGRAVAFVRLGLGSRLSDPYAAEQAVVRVGGLCRETYPSWEAFSAAYALARVIAYDDADDAELKYQESVAQHRVLAQDPASPYRNLPWS